jgi:flagellar protein FliO/FliZ
MDAMGEINLLSTGLKAMAMLCLVLGLLIVVLYLMKRFFFLGRKKEGNLFIKILTSMPLSPKQRIEVIEVMGEKIVLGVTPESIRFLTKLSDHPVNQKDHQGNNKDYETKE